jgi:shikimate dehydrogenase
MQGSGFEESSVGTRVAPDAVDDRVDGASGRCVVGLIGAGIGPSLSPPLHEREADRLGLRYVYQLIDLDHLGLGAEAVGHLLSEAQRMGFRGLNITHPCKRLVVEWLDELSPEAEMLGAVNTVVFNDGTAKGYNTDFSGFCESFVRGLADVAIDHVVVIGAGGAGAAVAQAVLTLGAKRLTIVDVEPEHAAELARQLSSGSGGECAVGGLDEIGAHLAGADGVINATPVGMAAHPGTPFAPALLRPDLWVADIVYRPLETELLRCAREVGCRSLNGGGMAVFQAAESFRLFTGLAPDPDRMLDHFADLVSEVSAAPVDVSVAFAS